MAREIDPVLLADTREPYNLVRMGIAARAPIVVARNLVEPEGLTDSCGELVKEAGSDLYTFTQPESPQLLLPFLRPAHTFVSRNSLDWIDREVNVLVYKGTVEPGQGHLFPYWHIDNQGDVGKPGVFSFYWERGLPLQFAVQELPVGPSVDPAELSAPGDDNLLGALVRPESIVSTEAESMNFATIYSGHRGTVAVTAVERTLVVTIYGYPEPEIPRPDREVVASWDPATPDPSGTLEI